MQKSVIFTEAFNCGKITKVALESFHRHHDKEVIIFGTEQDFNELGNIRDHVNNILIDCTEDEKIKTLYKFGHEGTAEIFARILGGQIGGAVQVIHFDGDCYFKKEIIGLIEDCFEEGYDIIGSRRCYQNNPANISVMPGLPDTISTYLFGIRKSVIPKYEHEVLRKMCKGSYNPLGHPVFDFFDPVTFVCLKEGAKIKFVDSNIIGGQNEYGSKINYYAANLHIDMGSCVAHFGGVGSGYSFYKDPGQQNVSYGNWALGRYSLFSKLFYNEDIVVPEATRYVGARWVSGDYDSNIINTIKTDLYE